MGRDAFILRMSYSEGLIEEGLANDEIIIGWSEAKGLLDKNLDWQNFREILFQTYAAKGDSYRAAGSWAGSMWRFIRDMKLGDLVVIPSGNKFYLARVEGEARYEDKYVNDDTAHRRTVKWLYDKNPIPRKNARVDLQSRMKAYQACVTASDLIDDIEEALSFTLKAENIDFSEELRRKLVERTLKEICSGRIDNYGFERLSASIIKSLGGMDTIIVSRSKDGGADILADFSVAEISQLKLAVQVKHYKPYPPVRKSEIDQLIKGMDLENANIGWFLTSGTFSQEAFDYHIELKEKGFNIELIDGDQLASLIVEKGIGDSGFLNLKQDEA